MQLWSGESIFSFQSGQSLFPAQLTMREEIIIYRVNWNKQNVLKINFFQHTNI